MLTATGWRVCDASDVHISAYRVVAIREFPLKKGYGFADYLLYVDDKAADLVKIYCSLTVEEAEQGLASVVVTWEEKYPTISQSWQRHWPNLITLFDYLDDIHKVIYTTNAIKSLNSVIRKAIKNRKVFPHDQAALKVVYLAIHAASKKWLMPIYNWKGALNRFMIEFSERMPETL